MADTAGRLAGFPLFSHLPKEIRLQIWEYVTPPARIIYLQRKNLALHQCTRIWSNAAISSPASFFDINHSTINSFDSSQSDTSDDEPDLEVGIDYGPETQQSCFRSQCLLPPLFFVCREFFEVLLSSYYLAFSDIAAHPQTWINFSVDALYLDWGIGWRPGGITYLPENFSPVITSQVRHLALHNTIGCYRRIWRHDHKEFICDILSTFRNLEVLTLVRKCHTSLKEECEDLVLMNDLDLLLWSDKKIYGECDKVDLDVLKEYTETWLEDDEGRLFSQWHCARLQACKRDVVTGGLPWNIPKVEKMIITTRRMQDRILDIVTEDQLEELQLMDVSWLLGYRHYPLRISKAQQVKYMKLVSDNWVAAAEEADGEENQYEEVIREKIARMEIEGPGDVYRERLGEAEDMDLRWCRREIRGDYESDNGTGNEDTGDEETGEDEFVFSDAD